MNVHLPIMWSLIEIFWPAGADKNQHQGEHSVVSIIIDTRN